MASLSLDEVSGAPHVLTAAYVCSACCMPHSRDKYSNSQHKLGKRRRCIACVETVEEGGAKERAAWLDHRASRGRIDGHHSPTPAAREEDAVQVYSSELGRCCRGESTSRQLQGDL
ncbi:hypothetical protein AB1Y20_017036 [Prymnesium parvum]|uniref:Uncharacterized protein n=1 Tax=Prymnesium parvum TaxID=97485 RepID=A0AB34IBH2_PRYPA